MLRTSSLLLFCSLLAVFSSASAHVQIIDPWDADSPYSPNNIQKSTPSSHHVPTTFSTRHVKPSSKRTTTNSKKGPATSHPPFPSNMGITTRSVGFRINNNSSTTATIPTNNSTASSPTIVTTGASRAGGPVSSSSTPYPNITTPYTTPSSSPSSSSSSYSFSRITISSISISGFQSISGFPTIPGMPTISATTPYTFHSSSTLAGPSTIYPSSSAAPLPYGTVTSFAAFEPCLSGTFLCLSSTTWAQCISSRTYVAMGSVAAGMECVPASVQDNDEGPLARGGGPAGTHRADTIVRAQPLGTCAVEGAMECLRGGRGWAQCAQGAWVDMGAVAAGTVCVGEPGDASIVAA